MRYITTIVVSVVLFLFVGCAGQLPQKHSQSRSPSTHSTVKGKELLARITVYWAKGKGADRYTRQHKSSTGVKLKSGACAVDPKRIPYGSKVFYPDGTNDVAIDTGSAVVARKAARRAGRTVYEKSALVIDKFFETKQRALKWARAHPMFIPVQIIPPVILKTETQEEDEEYKKWER